jgi:hypothetical protein
MALRPLLPPPPPPCRHRCAMSSRTTRRLDSARSSAPNIVRARPTAHRLEAPPRRGGPPKPTSWCAPRPPSRAANIEPKGGGGMASTARRERRRIVRRAKKRAAQRRAALACAIAMSWDGITPRPLREDADAAAMILDLEKNGQSPAEMQGTECAGANQTTDALQRTAVEEKRNRNMP